MKQRTPTRHHRINWAALKKPLQPYRLRWGKRVEQATRFRNFIKLPAVLRPGQAPPPAPVHVPPAQPRTTVVNQPPAAPEEESNERLQTGW